MIVSIYKWIYSLQLFAYGIFSRYKNNILKYQSIKIITSNYKYIKLSTFLNQKHILVLLYSIFVISFVKVWVIKE